MRQIGEGACLVRQDGPLGQAGQGGGACPIQETLHQACQGGDVPQPGIVCPEGVRVEVVDLRHHARQQHHCVAEVCTSGAPLVSRTGASQSSCTCSILRVALMPACQPT